MVVSASCLLPRSRLARVTANPKIKLRLPVTAFRVPRSQQSSAGTSSRQSSRPHQANDSQGKSTPALGLVPGVRISFRISRQCLYPLDVRSSGTFRRRAPLASLELAPQGLAPWLPHPVLGDDRRGPRCKVDNCFAAALMAAGVLFLRPGPLMPNEPPMAWAVRPAGGQFRKFSPSAPAGVSVF